MIVFSDKLYRKWQRLEPWQKDIIRDMYRRHLRECKRSNVEPEPRFLPEVIENMRKGMMV